MLGRAGGWRLGGPMGGGMLGLGLGGGTGYLELLVGKMASTLATFVQFGGGRIAPSRGRGRRSSSLSSFQGLLGAPVDMQGIPGTINEKRETLERMTSKLEVLNPHQAFVPLKKASAIPKLQYVLRASPTYLCR